MFISLVNELLGIVFFRVINTFLACKLLAVRFLFFYNLISDIHRLPSRPNFHFFTSRPSSAFLIRHNNLSLSSTKSQSRSLDILAKLLLTRSLPLLSHSVQLSLNTDSLALLFPASINTQSPTLPLISTSLITSNSDYINSPASANNNISQLPPKANLNDHLADILRLDTEPRLADIVQSILSRKNTTLIVTQQARHVSQWIVDTALALISAYIDVSRVSMEAAADLFAFSLLKDQAFLNEMRKGLIFVKLISTQQQHQQPVLPCRSLSYQKDLLAEMFSVLTRLVQRIHDKNEVPIGAGLVEQCAQIQADTINPHVDRKLFNLRHSWFGPGVHAWLKTYQLPVDYLFDVERPCQQQSLFDIVRLIEFSRSPLTKQCVHCGNYTESSSAGGGRVAGSCVPIQDLAGDRCVCGGAWVYSPIQ